MFFLWLLFGIAIPMVTGDIATGLNNKDTGINNDNNNNKGAPW